jgi:flagellar biosynthesis GTPase FlhF
MSPERTIKALSLFYGFMDILNNKPLGNAQSLKKDDAKKSKLIRNIKRIAGITLLSASLMLTTNCAGSKEYTKYDNNTYVAQNNTNGTKQELSPQEKVKMYEKFINELDRAGELLLEAEEHGKKAKQAAEEEAQLRKEAEEHAKKAEEHAKKAEEHGKKLKKLCEEGKEPLNELLNGCLDGDKDFCEAYEREVKDWERDCNEKFVPIAQKRR